MSDWSYVYRTESKLVSKYHENANVKVEKPLGYSDGAYDDIANGSIIKNAINKNKKGNKSLKSFDLLELKKKKMWELAISPAKNILINGIMSYMSPNEIQVIPIVMLFMLFANTFRELIACGEKFTMLDENMDTEVDPYDMIIWKFVYIISCIGNIGVGVWKLFQMGLIPNRQSDWLNWDTKLKSSDILI